MPLRISCLCALTITSACAPALPSFAGGSTTPAKRFDLGVGAASVIPSGGNTTHRTRLGSSGVAPVAWSRVGGHHNLDLGLTVAGVLGRLDVRRRWVLRQNDNSALSLAAGLAPYLGAIHVDGSQSTATHSAFETRGFRFGAEVPLALLFDIAGLYELWIGARFGTERLRADLNTDSAVQNLNGWRMWTGGVMGVGLGFRHIHVLMELNVLTEHAWYDSNAYQSGWPVILMPAFGVRYRL